MSDEEEKQPQRQQEEDIREIRDNFSNILFGELKKIHNEEQAVGLIKEWLNAFKDKAGGLDEQERIRREHLKVSQKRDFGKERRMISDAIKKLMSDNVTLKKAVVKLWKNQEASEEKVKQFDQLALAFQKINKENRKLKEGIDILKYIAKDKCNDKMLSNFNNFNNPGGPGIF